MSTIQSVINPKFLDRLSALKQGERREGAAVVAALKGQGDGESRLFSSVRFGAQSYAKALTAINFAGSFVNFARSDLGKLSSLTDQMIGIVEVAAKEKSGSSTRQTADRRLAELGSEFKKIVKSAKMGEREYLEVSGIKEVFALIGLEPSKDPKIKDVFNKFNLLQNDGPIADLNVKSNNPNPTPVGSGKAKSTHGSFPLFNPARTLTKRADAIVVLRDLQALSGQIKENLEVLDDLTQELSKNAILVRSTALAMLEAGDAITNETTAQDLARNIQRLILRSSREALSHSHNLEPIIVASLALEKEGIVGSKK